MEIITSSHNPRVKLIRNLVKKSWRQKTGMAFIEGTRLVYDTVKAGADIEFIGFCPDFVEDQDGKLMLSFFREQSQHLACFDRNLISEVTYTVNPQPLFAVVRVENYSWDDILCHDKLLIINQVQDPGNLGTIVRTADALGIGCIVTTKGSCDFYNPKALRSAMASTFHLPFMQGIENEHLYAQLKSNKYDIVVTSLASDAKPIRDFSFPSKTALIVGNEGAGVEEFWIDKAHHSLFIPIRGDAESLNVSIATGIVLYVMLQ